jgi:hypothetical protein
MTGLGKGAFTGRAMAQQGLRSAHARYIPWI